MKKNLLLAGFLLAGTAVFAQNKTLGVGVATPNPNAVLHVESPTGNQGFILPRLTTAQRTATAFVSALDADDNGLLVYDIDESGIFIWDGTAWTTPHLSYPYVDTVLSAPNGANLFRLVYDGSGTENVGVAHFENLNPNSGLSALFGRTNSATNGVADFIVNNPANTNDALGVVSNGLGTAGRFVVNNAANNSAAIYASTTGVPGATASSSAAILAETSTAFSAITARVPSGTSNAVSGITSSTDPGSWAGYFSAQTGTAVFAHTSSNVGGSLAPVAVYGESTGTGSSAASFRIANTGNTYSALYVETNGSGPAGMFRSTEPTSNGVVVYGESMGLGNVASFAAKNVGNTSAALAALHQGAGPTIQTAHANNGRALVIQNGGTSVSTYTVNSNTIFTRATAYLLNVTGSYSFDSSVTLNEGDIFYFYNNTGENVDVQGAVIPYNSGKTVIFLGGALRAF